MKIEDHEDDGGQVKVKAIAQKRGGYNDIVMNSEQAI